MRGDIVGRAVCACGSPFFWEVKDVKNFKLGSSQYEFLKWAAIIALPAIGLFYVTIARIWGLPYGDSISQTLDAVGLLIGALIGISTKNFYSDAVDAGVAEEEAPEEEE